MERQNGASVYCQDYPHKFTDTPKFSSMDSSIKVVIRIRPFLNQDQVKKAYLQNTEMNSTTNQSYHELIVEPPSQSAAPKSFLFDHVFGQDASQEEVYKRTVSDSIDKFLSGVNCTLISYGQTGSGKSYTMGTVSSNKNCTSNDQRPGIIPRAFRDIFESIGARRAAALETGQKLPEVTMICTFIELYNEDLKDLLLGREDPTGKPILLREDLSGQVILTGAKEIPIMSLEDAMACLQFGLKKRQTAKTALNETSSRSHAIFTLSLKQTLNQDDTGAGETLCSRLNFVDLAGSERLKRTQATGDRQKEGISINQGLLVLGKVVNSLASSQLSSYSCTSSRASLPPYRESKLTRLLQDSLGGNSQTVMIACISPVAQDFQETINTLYYATRAKIIKNHVRINKTLNESELSDKEGQQMKDLEREVERLRCRLEEIETLKSTRDTARIERDTIMMEEIFELRHQVEEQRFEIERLNGLLLEDNSRRRRSNKLQCDDEKDEEIRSRLKKLFSSET